MTDVLTMQLEQARAAMRARHYLPEPDALAPLIGAGGNASLLSLGE